MAVTQSIANVIYQNAVYTGFCKRLLVLTLCLEMFLCGQSNFVTCSAPGYKLMAENKWSSVTGTQLRGKQISPVNHYNVSVWVKTSAVHRVLDERYASFGIDSSLILQKLAMFNTSSPRLLTLARALRPCYVRFGGTSQDALLFNVTSDEENTLRPAQTLPEGPKNFTMTVSEWGTINKFVNDVGWELVFGLNLLYRKDSKWDPFNAVSLMKYSNNRGYRMHLELGNEPDSFKHVFKRPVDPKQAGKDFGVLRDWMKSFPVYNSSLLIGPDVTRPIKNKGKVSSSISSQNYLKRFLKTGARYLDVVCFHHYYARSQTATESDFINPSVLDSLKAQITQVQAIMNSTSVKGKQLWLGEAGSTSGRGAPYLSNRYIAGFMWLDRLGLSAVHGVDVVIRQSFYKGNYAMIDRKDYTPFPDYWVTLLYKRLVGRSVLLTSLNQTTNYVRIYASCTKRNRSDKTTYAWYTPGAVTLFMLNLLHTDVNVKLVQPEFQESDLHLYMLTPEGEAGLNSRFVSLNGKVLELIKERELPDLQPQKQSGDSPVHIKALTFGFVVIPNANVTICR